MYDWLSHRVRASPERTALVRAATGETLDFARLDAMVEDLAGRLVGLGVEAGDHLGMLMETRLAAVCTVHAAERLGAVLVPLGDGLTAGELAAQIDAADVTSLVCSSETEGRAVDAFDGPVCSVDDPDHPAVTSLAEASVADVDPTDWGLNDTRLLLFTSGTTGAPKVVRLTVGNLLASAVASMFRLGFHRDDRWLVGLSLDHMGGLSPVLRMPLYGMTIVLRESFEPGRTADDIGNYDVTCVSLVPTMLKRMLDLRGTLADSLRVVLLGGAPAPDDLVQRCRDFSVPVHPTYGMTETASQVATATPREAFRNVGTVGRPLFWTSVAVHETDGPGLVDTGEVGELVVDGPTVSPGYYGDPDATDAAFGPDGLRTGDVGYRDADGWLYVVGRVDDRIITGGENVYPREVVDAIRSHPGVVDAAVVGLPDDEWGELVGALVVPADDELTVGELDDHCRERLAGFKLPRVVAFAEELPRTESGTVRRDTVRDRLVGETAIPAAEGGRSRAVDDPATDDGDGGRPPDEAVEGPTESDPPDGDTADVADAEADTGPGPAEAYLVGGSDWTLGDDDPDEELDDGSSDIVTDASAGDPSDEATVEDDADTVDTDPETPDFVQEALAEGPTTGSSNDDGAADEPVEDWSEVPETSEGSTDDAAPANSNGTDDPDRGERTDTTDAADDSDETDGGEGTDDSDNPDDSGETDGGDGTDAADEPGESDDPDGTG